MNFNSKCSLPHVPCDVVIVSGSNAMFINGTEIGCVLSFNVERRLDSDTMIVLTIKPTSFQVVKRVEKDILSDPADTVEEVDIERAIRSALERTRRGRKNVAVAQNQDNQEGRDAEGNADHRQVPDGQPGGSGLG